MRYFRFPFLSHVPFGRGRGRLRRRRLPLAAGALALAAVAGVLAVPQHVSDAAISRDVLKIGVLNDQSGHYAAPAGPGSVEAARMAVEDFGGEVNGRPIEILSADHQNDPELGAGIAREWVEVDGVDAIVDVPASGVALEVQDVARETDTALLVAGSASGALTGEACAPTTVQWVYHTRALAAGALRPALAGGAESWFFVTADDPFGAALEADARALIGEAGGEVLGHARHALGADDLTAHLMEAQGSEADAIAFANAGGDAVRALATAHELGVRRGPQRLVPLLVFLTDVRRLGLEAAQGLPVTTAFYWDRTDSSRAFAERFAARRDGRKPTMVQAGVYSAVMHYLKAVAEIGGDGGAAAVRQMKRMPVDDFFAEGGRVRADGLLVHDLYRARVKAPGESAGPWDLYEITGTIPAERAFPPLSESACPLVEG